MPMEEENEDLLAQEPSEDDDKFYTPPAPTGEKGDSRRRLREYIAAQSKGMDRKMDPSYQQSQGQGRMAMGQNAIDNSYGALLMDSASKFGNVAGKTPDASAFGQMSRDLNQQQAQYAQNIARDEAGMEQDADKQMKLYQYLAQMQREDGADQVARMRAEAAAQKANRTNWQNLKVTDAQGYPLERDAMTGQTRRIPGAAPERQKGDEVNYGKEIDPVTGDVSRWNPRTGTLEPTGQKVGVKSNSDKPAQNQSAAATYVKRAEQAQSALDALEKEGYDTTSWSDRAIGGLPFGIGDVASGEEFKRLSQAEENFLSAVLRKESGASISAGERSEAGRMYFPRPGDTPAVKAQKAATRAQAIAGLKAEAGPAYEHVATVDAPAKVTDQRPGTATAAPAFKPLHQMTREEKLRELEQLNGGGG